MAFALGKLGDDTTIALLAPMLEDEEWEVRANAALALGSGSSGVTIAAFMGPAKNIV